MTLGAIPILSVGSLGPCEFPVLTQYAPEPQLSTRFQPHGKVSLGAWGCLESSMPVLAVATSSGAPRVCFIETVNYAQKGSSFMAQSLPKEPTSFITFWGIGFYFVATG